MPPILCYLLMRRVFICSCKNKSFERKNYCTLIIFIHLQTFCLSHLMTFMTYLGQRDTIRGLHLPCNYMEEILHVANSLWSLISYLSPLSPYIGLCGICFFLTWNLIKQVLNWGQKMSLSLSLKVENNIFHWTAG